MYRFYQFKNIQQGMFAQFENMIKGKINSLKESAPTDISRVPQKYTIKGKVIQQVKLLSEGSFGFIWLAHDLQTKQKYALKRIVCITNERFQLAKNQLQLMLKFPKSKNIVECFGGQLVTLRNGNVQNKVIIILMEYCPNGTLFDLLSSRQNKGFSEVQLLKIASSILQGLKSIHQTGCYHQDVKIQNVLIGEDNSFKLCDFGSCSNRFIDFRAINKSQYGHIKQEIEAVTTPMYRPPEIVDPYLQYELSFKIDMWMVGCVLYTLSYFTHPFVDSNAVGIAGGVYRFPKYPDETSYKVSQKMKDFIRNLLTPNPAYRLGVQQALDIISKWNALSEIPLNKQARRRREQQKILEKELQTLNRKVVDFDGDIPLDKLMQIQQKLKNKESNDVAKQTSFITSKQTLLIKQKVPMLINNNPPNIFNFGPSSSQTVKKVQQPQVKQQTVNANLFWNTNTQNSAVNIQIRNTGNTTNKFDQFSSFFQSSQPQAKKQNNNNDMYNFFFADEGNPPKNIEKKESNNKIDNLLDL